MICLILYQVLHPCAGSINRNNKVWNMYFRDLLPRLVKLGDDGNCGSAALCDTVCLQVCHKQILLCQISKYGNENREENQREREERKMGSPEDYIVIDLLSLAYKTQYQNISEERHLSTMNLDITCTKMTLH